MKYRIVYSLRSQRDLVKIKAWIAAESQTPATAIRFLGQLLDACDSLAIFPERFAIYPPARDFRMMPYGNYLVFFKVRAREVRIGHVRHAARKPFRN
jgi:plasmid stabilization system protein ParE